MCSSVVLVLQQHVKNLKQQNEILLQRYDMVWCISMVEDRVWGSLAFCHRKMSLQKMKSVIEESGCDIPDTALDSAHRIGKYDPSGKNVRRVIVRFTTFRHRTMFYRARKNLSKNGVYLDLTKERFTYYIRKLEMWSNQRNLLSMSMLMWMVD